jgi:hypothetical protein
VRNEAHRAENSQMQKYHKPPTALLQPPPVPINWQYEVTSMISHHLKRQILLVKSLVYRNIHPRQKKTQPCSATMIIQWR